MVGEGNFVSYDGTSVKTKETLLSKPGPPSNLRVVSKTGGTVRLKWDPPRNRGGGLISGYRVYSGPCTPTSNCDLKYSECIPLDDFSPHLTQSCDTRDNAAVAEALIGRGGDGLQNGMEYTFRVLAVNFAGQSGSLSSPISVTMDVSSSPDKPQWREPAFLGKGHPRNSTSPTWRAALDDGGSAIKNYILEGCNMTDDVLKYGLTICPEDRWFVAYEGDSDSPVISPLKAAKLYSWRVKTVTQSDASEWSNTREKATESGAKGLVHFRSANYEVYENTGEITVAITRVEGSSGVLSVLLNTSAVAHGIPCYCNDVMQEEGTTRWNYEDKNQSLQGPFSAPTRRIAKQLACEHEGCPLCEDEEPYIYREFCSAIGCPVDDDSENCDYREVEDTILTFNDGQLFTEFTIQVIDDNFCENPNERFAINLKPLNKSDPSIVVSNPSTTEVLIREDGDAGGIEFEIQSAKVVSEDVGQVRLKLIRRRECPNGSPNAKSCQVGESGYSGVVKIHWMTQKGKASPGQMLDGSGDYRPHPSESSDSLGNYAIQEVEFTDQNYERYIDIVIVNDEVYDFHDDATIEKDIEDLTVRLDLIHELYRDPQNVEKGFKPGYKVCAPYLLSKTSRTIKIIDDGDEMEPAKPPAPYVVRKTGGALYIGSQLPDHQGGVSQKLVAFDYQKCTESDIANCIECYNFNNDEAGCNTAGSACRYDYISDEEGNCVGGWLYVAKGILPWRNSKTRLDNFTEIEAINGQVKGKKYFPEPADKTIHRLYTFDTASMVAELGEVGLTYKTEYFYRVAAVNFYGDCSRYTPTNVDICKSALECQAICTDRLECSWKDTKCEHNGRSDRMCKEYLNAKVCNIDVRCRWHNLTVSGDVGTCVLSGRSEWSDPLKASTSETPTGPGAPAAPTLVEGSTTTGGMITVRWDAPGDTGGIPITRYRLFKSDGFGGFETVYDEEYSYIQGNDLVLNLPGEILPETLSGPRSAVIGGFSTQLDAATKYLISVSAENLIAIGSRSPPLEAFTTQPTAPSLSFFSCNCFKIPVGCSEDECRCSSEYCDTTSTSGGSLRLSWIQPFDSGGQAIDYYILQTDYGDVSKPVTNFSTMYKNVSTSFLWEGLLANSRYRFRLGAANSFVNSNPEKMKFTEVFSVHQTPYTFMTKSVTPAGPPTNIKEIITKKSGGTITITWSPPSDTGGVEVSTLRYEVLVVPSNPKEHRTASDHRCKVEHIHKTWKPEKLSSHIGQSVFCSGNLGTESRFKAICHDTNNPEDEDGITTSPLGCTIYGFYEKYTKDQEQQVSRQRLWASEITTKRFYKFYVQAINEVGDCNPETLEESTSTGNVFTTSTPTLSSPVEEISLLPAVTTGGRLALTWNEPIDIGGVDMVRYKVFVSVTKNADYALVPCSDFAHNLTSHPACVIPPSSYDTLDPNEWHQIFPNPDESVDEDLLNLKIELTGFRFDDSVDKNHESCNSTPMPQSCRYVPLVADTTYAFIIFPENALDTTQTAKVVSVSTSSPSHPGIMDAPTVVNRGGLESGGSLQIAWKPPLDRGGKKITTYHVLLNNTHDPGAKLVKVYIGSNTTCIIGGLKANSNHAFVIIAENAALLQSNYSKMLITATSGATKAKKIISPTKAAPSTGGAVSVGFATPGISKGWCDHDSIEKCGVTTGNMIKRQLTPIFPSSVPPISGQEILSPTTGSERVYLNIEPCCDSNIDFGGMFATSYEILKEVFASPKRNEFRCSELKVDLGNFATIEECLKACLDAGDCKTFAFENSGTDRHCMKCSEGIDKAVSSVDFDLFEAKMEGDQLDKSIFYQIQPEDIYYDRWENEQNENAGYHNYNRNSKAFLGRSPTGIGADYFPAVVVANLKPATAYRFKSRITSAYNGNVMVGSESPVLSIMTTTATRPTQPMLLQEASKSGGGFTLQFVAPQDFGGFLIRTYAVSLKLEGDMNAEEDKYKQDIEYGILTTYINPDPSAELQPRISVEADVRKRGLNEVVIVNLLAGKKYTVVIWAISNKFTSGDATTGFRIDDQCTEWKHYTFDENQDEIIEDHEISSVCIAYENDLVGTSSEFMSVTTSQPSPPTWGSTISSCEVLWSERTVGSIAVRWRPPADDGGVGGKLTYRVETKPYNDTTASWYDIPPIVVSNRLTAVIDGLAQETSYRVRVIAINKCCEVNCRPDHCESKTDLLDSNGVPVVNASTGEKIRILQGTDEVIGATGSNIAAPDSPKISCISTNAVTISWSDAPNVQGCQYTGFYIYMKKCAGDTLCQSGGYDPNDGGTFDPLDGFHRVKAANGNDTHPKIVQYKRPTGQNRYNITIRELDPGATYLFRVSAINKTFYPTEQAKTACITGDLANCVKNSHGPFFTSGEGPISEIKSNRKAATIVKMPTNTDYISCYGGQENLHRTDTAFNNTIYRKGLLVFRLTPERVLWTASDVLLPTEATMEIRFTQFDMECDHDYLSIKYIDGTEIWKGGCRRETPFTVSFPFLRRKGLTRNQWIDGQNGIVMTFSGDDSIFYEGVRFSYTTWSHDDAGNNNNNMIDDLSKIPCPSGCEFNDRGTCVGYRCVCKQGFIGEDCSAYALCPRHELCSKNPESIVLVDGAVRDMQGTGEAMLTNASSIKVPKPYKTISQAISKIKNGEKIMIVPGTYSGHLNCNLNFKDFNYDIESLVYTPIQGRDKLVFNLDTKPVEISCNGEYRWATCDSSDVIIAGLNIRDGYVPDKAGGAISSHRCNMQLRYTSITNSTALTGGGIYSERSELRLTNTVVHKNVAFENGGGLALNRSNIFMANTTIIENSAKNTGGGIYAISVNIHTLHTLAGCMQYAAEIQLPFASKFYESDVEPIGCWKKDGTIYFNNNENSLVPCESPGLKCPPGKSNSAICYNNIMCATGYSCWYAGDVLKEGETSPLPGKCRQNTFCRSCVKNFERVVIEKMSGFSELSRNKAEENGGNIGISVGSNTDIIRVDVTTGIASNGGGIFVLEAQLSLNGVMVNANEADFYGGGIYGKGKCILYLEKTQIFRNMAMRGAGIYGDYGIDISAADVFGSAVSANVASANGGGIYIASHVRSTLENVFVKSNKANQNGGGLHNSKGTIRIVNCIFLENEASMLGGGIHIDQQTHLSIVDSSVDHNIGSGGGGVGTNDYYGPNYVMGDNTSVSYNHAIGSSACGGNIMLQGGLEPLYVLGLDRDAAGCDSSHISGLTVAHGHSDNNGGGFCIPDCAGHLSNIILIENIAESDGGGIYHAGHAVYIYDTVVRKNRAQRGAGAFLLGNSAEILGNPVIVENVASSYGGGVALLSAKGVIGANKDGGEATVVVMNNQALQGGGLYLTGGTPTLSRLNILENNVGTLTNGIYVNGRGGGIYAESQVEKQRFTCRADDGFLQFKHKDSNIVKVPVKQILPASQLKAALETLTTIDEVNVKYNGGKSVCDADGNNEIEIEFVSDKSGDMPLLDISTPKISNELLSLRRRNEIQVIYCKESGNGGQFVITYEGRNVTIDAYDGAAALESKLLSILSGVSVKLNGIYPLKACFAQRNRIEIEFNGIDELGDQQLLQIHTKSDGLEVSVETIVDGRSGVVSFEGKKPLRIAENPSSVAKISIEEDSRGHSPPALTLINVQIMMNSALGGTGSGGGVYVEEGVMLHMDSSVILNKGAIGGGLYFGLQGGFEHIVNDPQIPNRMTEKLRIDNNEACQVYTGIFNYKTNIFTGDQYTNEYIDSWVENACYEKTSGLESGPGKYLGGNLALFGNVVLSGLDITRGSAESGGAVYINDKCNGGLSSCKISHNSATSNGGGLYVGIRAIAFIRVVSVLYNNARYGAGVYADRSYVEHEASFFINNTASRQGGGIYVKDDTSFIGFATELSGNTVVASVGDTTSDALGGAGLYIKGTGFLLSGLTTRHSISEKGGAAFINKDAIGTFANSTFANNYATHSEGGGGLYIDQKCNVVFRNCTFRENIATRGGGTTVAGATATFINSKFIENKADIDGGGIWIKGEGCRVYFDGVTVAGNVAERGNGGGVTLTDSTTPLDPPELHCINSHIIGNRAALGNGGGIYVDKRMQAVLVDSIVHGNFYGKLWTKSDVDASFFLCRHLQTVYNFVPGQNFGTLERQPSFSLQHPVVLVWTANDCELKVRNALNGGGVYAGSFAKIHVTRSNISHSNATAGGGVYMDKGATGIFDKVDIHSNFAQFGAGTSFILGVTANVIESRLYSNRAQYDGGACYIEDSTITFRSSVIRQNLAESRGGGVYVDKNGQISVNYTDFYQNAALSEAGAVYMGHNSIGAFQSCKFEENWATSSGGALFVTSTTNVVVGDDKMYLNPLLHPIDPDANRQCQFVNNSVNNSETDLTGDGGALFITRGGAVEVNGCDFKQNIALKGNGGVLGIHGRNVNV